MERLSGHFQADAAWLDATLGVGKNYDILGRNILIGGRRCRFWFVDGYADDGTLERMTAFWLSLPAGAAAGVSDPAAFAARFITFDEVSWLEETEALVTHMLSGKLLLLAEGIRPCFAIDVKHFPSRSVQEPEDSRVLRGAHDGFVETLVHNAALLRRRIRDPRLTMEAQKIGTKSRTDVVICYMDGLADEALLTDLRNKLSRLDAQSFSMGQESVAEALLKKQRLNPMPRVRYTERPDVASACLLEGDILLMVDNSPAVMLLPTTLLDFVQEANDFYFPPLVGSYLRIIRVAVILLSLVITPVWFLLVNTPENLPAALTFLAVKGDFAVGLFWQLLLVELIVDVLKLASLDTPSVLSSSFSMLGALILGDFAVKARWLVPEVLVYMAFVAIASFAQPSYELGYAMKLFRMLLLIFSALMGWGGFALGLLLILLLAATTKPIVGTHYFRSARRRRPAWNLLIRRPIDRRNT